MNRTQRMIVLCFAVLSTACHRGSTAHESAPDPVSETARSTDASSEVEEMGEAAGVAETIIYGKVIDRWMDQERFEGDDHPCDLHPCEARIEVVSIQQTGSDHHGQFEEGSEIEVHFDFTLDATEKIFPELNRSFEGLNEGDFFKATIHTSAITDHPDRYRVDEYEKQ